MVYSFFDILYQHWIMWWFLSSNASNAPRYLGWGFATKHHATQNSSSLPLVLEPCFFEVKPLYKDLQTWCCLAFLCGLRWTCRPNGHMSKWCSRCVTVMFNVPGNDARMKHIKGVWGTGEGAVVYFFWLEGNEFKLKINVRAHEYCNKYQYTCFFNFGN